MLKKEYQQLLYGDLVRPNGGPLRGLVLEVVNAEGDDIFTQQQNNPAFVYVRNYRAFDLVHHFTDLERKIQELHDTVWERRPYPDRGNYPAVESTVSKDYYAEKIRVQFANRSEERITEHLYFLLSEVKINTFDDLIAADPDIIMALPNLDAAEKQYVLILRENEIRERGISMC